MKRLFIILILIIFFLAIGSGLILTGKEKIQKPLATTTQEEITYKPLSITKKEEIKIETSTEIFFSLTSSIPFTQTPSPYQRLINKQLIYIDLDYPLLYVYDPSDKVIKYIDLENEVYRELYKTEDFEKAEFSQDKNLLILKNSSGYHLLDFKNDLLYNLDKSVKNYIFALKDLVLYLNNESTISELSYFKEGKLIKIRDLGILNPVLYYFKNKLLVYEENSPVFALDLTNSNNFVVFLDPSDEYQFLRNKNDNLLFISIRNKGVNQSRIVDLNQKEIKSFDFFTKSEKCSFDSFLICASLDNKNIIIFDPKTKKEKKIEVEGIYEIVKPKITPLGIIFWDKLTFYFYVINPEKFSF